MAVRRTHVGHRASDGSERSPLGKVHRDVEISQVCVTFLVEQDVVRLDIPVHPELYRPIVSVNPGTPASEG